MLNDVCFYCVTVCVLFIYARRRTTIRSVPIRYFIFAKTFTLWKLCTPHMSNKCVCNKIFCLHILQQQQSNDGFFSFPLYIHHRHRTWTCMNLYFCFLLPFMTNVSRKCTSFSAVFHFKWIFWCSFWLLLRIWMPKTVMNS